MVQVSDNGDLEVYMTLALVNELYGANGQLDPMRCVQECQLSALEGESWTNFAARLDAFNQNAQNRDDKCRDDDAAPETKRAG